MPAVSIGSPVKLFASVFETTRLRPNGVDVAGNIYIARRPDDPIASESFLTLALARAQGNLINHSYTTAWHGDRVLGGVWGISGPGILCSAEDGGGCPRPLHP